MRIHQSLRNVFNFSFKREAYLIAAISFLPVLIALIASIVYLLLK